MSRTHTLRAALRYFQERLQSQEAQLRRLQRHINEQDAELARCRTALEQQPIDTSRPPNRRAGRDAGATGRLDTGGRAARVRSGRRVLQRIARKFRRLLPRAWRGLLGAAPTQPVDPHDYRVRMRALHASGQLARVRTVALVAPERLSRAASAVAELIDGMSLRCSVRTAMPTTFSDDLYVVLSPGSFEVLPPPERRILWLVDSDELAEADTAAVYARLNTSLGVFEAVQPRIVELQALGLVQHQIFHVPLSPFSSLKPVRADLSPLGLPHMLARALHGCGVLKDSAFEAATAQTCLDAPAIVLCLPEAPERFAHARESLRHGALLFPGLRHVDGWKGTASSYRYLARRALQAQHQRLIIWEDDARLPEDFDVRLPALLAQLEAKSGEWDLFSGLITDLSPQGQVKAVEPYDDDLFIEIDTVIGMVFGIYGPTAMQALADYRPQGEDVMKATIDRYLETLDLRCCTLFPPLVGHADHLSSTIWDPTGRRFLSNDSFNPMIVRSQLRLLSKVADVLDRTSEPSSHSPGSRTPAWRRWWLRWSQRTFR